MTDYFFISSPLHFCIAANIAIKNPTHRNVALIMSKNSAVSEAYAAAARHHPEIFHEVISLSRSVGRGGVLNRKDKFRLLREMFSQRMEMRIFTGSDRRSEFQYAMYVATGSNGHVEGIYMDDGIISYVGHKSMDKIQHRYVDPFLKKLFRGRWWKNSLTAGATDWVETLCVAFPEAVHPLLKNKKTLPIDAEVFKSDKFVALASELIDDCVDLREQLTGIRVVVTLPHEAGFLEKQAVYAEVNRKLGSRFQHSEIAVKAHPRSRDFAALKKQFPGALLLDSRIGMEFMLPLLHDECLVIGDISTTLLTAKWLRPDLAVIALKVFGDIPDSMMALYDMLHIETVAVERLSDSLTRTAEKR